MREEKYMEELLSKTDLVFDDLGNSLLMQVVKYTKIRILCVNKCSLERRSIVKLSKPVLGMKISSVGVRDREEIPQEWSTGSPAVQ